MFIDVLNWILEDKETKNSQYFCRQKNITEQEFYYFLATLEKELLIKKQFFKSLKADNHLGTSLLHYELTLKGKSFLKL